MMTIIGKTRLAFGLLTVASALALPATPAFAEFTSHNKSSEGNKTVFALNIEEIGGTINCGSLEEGPTWRIKKEGLPAEVGPILRLKFKSLAKCVVEYKEGESVKETKATSTECEWEINEPSSEDAVTLTAISTCTIKPELAKPCEVKIEPTANKKRETVALFDSGEKSENLDLNLELTKVTVTVSGEGCEPAGLKTTSLAKVSGAMELREIQPGMTVGQFGLSAPTVPVTFPMLKAKREIFVTNLTAGPAATPERAGVSRLVTGLTFGLWVSENKTVAECAATALNQTQSCKMEAKLETSGGGRARTGSIEYLEGATKQAEMLLWTNV